MACQSLGRRYATCTGNRSARRGVISGMHGRTHPFPAALAVVAFFATACGSAGTNSTDSPTRSAPQPVRVSLHQQQTLAVADTAFARSLWAKLATDGGNVVLSPASIATALQMAYVGARGETAAEMATTLHLGPDATLADIAAAADGLLTTLGRASTKDTLVKLADEVWLQRDFPVVPDFKVAMARYFGSTFQLADFAGHGEEARKAINAAIAAQTRDRIQDLLPSGTDLSAARLVLTNAIYMKAAWAAPFEKSLTAPAAFTRADGSVVRPETMNATESFDYAATGDYQAVRLPYSGGRLAMTLLLPAKGQPLTWPAATPTFRSHTVDLALPKFTFSWGADLAKLLGELGMPSAFGDGADFTGMSPKPLRIGAVQHKAFIAVDENGTEAAAATAVDILAGGAAVTGAIPHVHFDRPFLFRIDDTATGLPLFLGKVADPTLGG